MKKPRTPKTRPLFISRQSMAYSKGYYRENLGTKIGHVSVIIHSNFGTLPSTTQHNILHSLFREKRGLLPMLKGGAQESVHLYPLVVH